MTTPVADFVKRYAEADMSRFHMPGHKGLPMVGCEALDITEVAGADALYEASGIIAESEANATSLFGSGHTFYSTEGSSLCIRAMIFLAVQAWKKRRQDASARPVILAARNAHKAFLYACALTDCDVHWLYPQPEAGSADQGLPADRKSVAAPAAASSICSCPITPAAAETAILEERSRTGTLPVALYVTSPDYLGGSQDLSGLAALCRRYDIPLLVDNAHGAYLKFLDTPSHPMDLGASMCCDSAHKTLPVLTGGAYLHISKDFPLDHISAARQALALFGSTSPSYLILQSLDLCNAKLAGTWPKALAETISLADSLKEKLRALGYTVANTEPLKITIFTRGDDLADALRPYKVECEHSDNESCIFMFTPENSPRDFDRLFSALAELAPVFLKNTHASPITDDHSAPSCNGLAPHSTPSCNGLAPHCSCSKEDYVPVFLPVPASLSIRDAVFSPSEAVSPEDALGRICAAPVVSCPPAIPIAVSGEVITENTVKLFRHYGIDTVRVIL
ncbi:MAG: amino acid decarboxylase [Clostridiales bacterium]|nr:amino acid decarboxylase [Clostridiales bacterium]